MTEEFIKYTLSLIIDNADDAKEELNTIDLMSFIKEKL